MKLFRHLLLALAILAAPIAAQAALTFSRTTTGSATAQTYGEGRQKAPALVAATVYGTWGGTTITIQESPDGGTTWIDVGVSLTANGKDYFYATPGNLLRVTATGGTGISLTIIID